MLIDIRGHISMNQISEVLLQIAQHPLKYAPQVTEGRIEPQGDTLLAAPLARQACAGVISNCVTTIWSCTVNLLQALEPEFPLYPKDVSEFVKDSRLPFLSYVSIYYHMCGKPFDKTTTAEKIKLIVDMRHDIEHDKPEDSNDYSPERVKKVKRWADRLRPHIGKPGLEWLPRVRTTKEPMIFHSGGEPPIFKLMKYPVAKWAFDATQHITAEMSGMMFAHRGKKRLLSAERPIDASFSDKRFMRIWASGE
jgi:hypothetical protein